VLVMPAPDEAHFFNTAATGEPGFDREIVDRFAQLHDLELEVVTVASWGELVPALLADRGDVIAGTFTATTARKRQIAFSVEVFPTRIVVVTRDPEPAVESIETLRGTKVGCIVGSSPAAALRAAGVPQALIDDGIPSGGLLAALEGGRVQAAALEVPAAILAQRDDPAIRLGVFLGPPASLAYGVRKQDTALLAALDQYLGHQRLGLGWSRLVVKYFGQSAPEILKRARAN
jgi:ABC-type amino acid transport substrate-binding protein